MMDREGGHGALSGAAWCRCPALSGSIDAAGAWSALSAGLGAEALEELGNRHLAEIAALVRADGDRARVGLAVPEHEHVRRAGELRVADLAPDRFRALVDPAAEFRLTQLGRQLAGALVVAV